MTMNEKIEILLTRKKMHKTDLANRVGITYRAVANYMSGNRKPRKSILVKIADELEIEPGLLFDDKYDLTLTVEETFINNTCHNEKERVAAIQFFEKSRGLFAGNAISDKDMDLLMNALCEIYADSRKNPKE